MDRIEATEALLKVAATDLRGDHVGAREAAASLGAQLAAQLITEDRARRGLPSKDSLPGPEAGS